MSTTTSSTDISFAPLRMSPPICFALAASSRPCTDLQVLARASITRAMPRIVALKSPCPIPSATCEMRSAPNATRIEPSNPAASPAPIQRLRPGIPCVAAVTTPMMRAASRTSRNTMSAVPNMALLGDDHALGGLLVELAGERVFARLQGADDDRGLRLGGGYLLD